MSALAPFADSSRASPKVREVPIATILRTCDLTHQATLKGVERVRLGCNFQHREDLVGAFDLCEDTLHGLQLSLVGIAVHFGDRIFDDHHIVIVLDAAADCVGDANAGRNAGHHTSVHVHIAEDRVQRRVREATETLLDYEVLAFMGF